MSYKFSDFSILDALAEVIKRIENSPKIRDLPKHIQDLALNNMRQQNKAIDLDKQIQNAFNWEKSKEGYSFWMEIFEGNYGAYEESSKKSAPAETPATPTLENGEEVEVSDNDIAWSKAKFIGMHEKLFVVANGIYIFSYPRCRKISQPSEEKEDKNAFVKGLKPEDFFQVSEKLFGSDQALELLNLYTPSESPRFEASRILPAIII